MNVFLIALGANLNFGDQSPKDTLNRAVAALEREDVHVDAVSRFYRTPCFPPGAGPDYVNATARVTASLDPQGLLDRLHKIEAEFGRSRDTRWGMRTLDLDLLAAGDTILPDQATFNAWRDLSTDAQKSKAPDELILPHPRLQDRAFVLVPLSDVAADWRHPVLNRTVTEMCDALSPDDLVEIVAL